MSELTRLAAENLVLVGFGNALVITKRRGTLGKDLHVWQPPKDDPKKEGPEPSEMEAISGGLEKTFDLEGVPKGATHALVSLRGFNIVSLDKQGNNAGDMTNMLAVPVGWFGVEVRDMPNNVSNNVCTFTIAVVLKGDDNHPIKWAGSFGVAIKFFGKPGK